ncbi:MAG TPA: DUF1697 domain-containing protein [Thermoleophilaceae bacterium]|nr:DUF1697 domain-containing protein [Thermoleophilaceae bacterium]
MVFVALLRGVNVGGKNRVEMARLRESFERLGFEDVRTYINSGNVIFRYDGTADPETIERALAEEFGFEIRVTLRDKPSIDAVAAALPDDWVNDDTMKCDVMFLWDGVDSHAALEDLTVKPGIDEVKPVEGALIWRVDRPAVTRSGLMKVAGSDLYKSMTVRNCNTLRKLAALMDAV